MFVFVITHLHQKVYERIGLPLKGMVHRLNNLTSCGKLKKHKTDSHTE